MSNFKDSIDDPSLLKSIEELVQTHPASEPILQRLIDHLTPPSKRRKTTSQPTQILARLPDVSCQLPARKKYDIVLTPTRLILHNPKTQQDEYDYDLQDFLQSVLVKTTGEKVTMTLLTRQTAVVWNHPDRHHAIIGLLRDRIPMTEPTDFKSSSQAGKDHVVAYLKAKDGLLYFLPTGILYGFKKPTFFIPTSHLESSVFSHITQRTFDLCLSLKEVGWGADMKLTVEFSLIEQSEYEAIDGYLKRLGLNDKSMSEERKAVKGKEVQEEEVEEGEESDEENDEDFEPSEDDDEPLEYDTDAEGSGDELKEDDDQLDEESD